MVRDCIKKRKDYSISLLKTVCERKIECITSIFTLLELWNLEKKEDLFFKKVRQGVELNAIVSSRRQKDLNDSELNEVNDRLDKFFKEYDFIRQVQLKARQDELSKTRVEIEAEMLARGVDQVDVAMVRAYAQDLRSLLEEADFTERKAFLRSFIKRIEVNKRQVTVHHNLPIPQGMPSREQVGVLPIETLGGDRGIRTPNLCDANAALSLLSYIPANSILATLWTLGQVHN